MNSRLKKEDPINSRILFPILHGCVVLPWFPPLVALPQPFRGSPWPPARPYADPVAQGRALRSLPGGGGGNGSRSEARSETSVARGGKIWKDDG